MANYEYIQATGVVVPDTSEVKQQVIDEFKSALGQDLDVSDSTPQGRLIEAETIARKRTIENMALISNMFNPNQAFGIFLDSIAKLFGIERVGATRTRVLCQVTGEANTVIPENAQASDINGKIYYSENDITIDTDGNGSGYFLCMDKGAVECQANTLTQIVTAVLGWNTINNATAGNIGLDEESDNTLRQRMLIDQFQGVSLLKAIHSAIMRVDEVEDCLVIDNPTNTSDTTTISGITIPPHSLFICVDGGKKEDVAQAIFDNKSAGCGYTTGTGQTQTVTVTDQTSGQQYSVSFDRPVYVSIDVEVTLGTGQATATVISQIKQAIIDYVEGNVRGVDGLTIGKNVSSFEIASAITQEIPDVFITNVEIAKHEQTLSTNEITINANERATIDIENITVS